ncbi:MAG: hypothetical protein ACXVXY_04785 [Mycobacteriaceae bacterium]
MLSAVRLDVGTADQSVTLRPMMSMFMAVLVTFVCTRVITRRIRSRTEPGGALKDIAIGGVHIHHQVFGIVIMLCSGMALISATPEGVALHVVAAVFGVGVSLTFDEFALWLHVEDVYWSTEGRQSVDAMFCVLVTTGLLVGGVDFVTGAVGTLEWWVSVAVLALDLALSVICVLKGKLITAVIGLFLQPVAIAGAIRLAKPRSWWGRRRYPLKPHRLARAERRFGAAYEARWNRARDFVGGSPDQ